MIKPVVGFLVLVAAIAALGGTVHSQGPRGQIEEVTLLDNESMRAVLLTYAPGADSDLHLNPGPEVTIVQEGELVLYTGTGGREVLRAGAVYSCITDDLSAEETRGLTGRSVLHVHRLGMRANRPLGPDR